MLELSDIQSSPEELQDYYAQLRAQHVTPAWIGGGISTEPHSKALPYLWHWRGFSPPEIRGAALVRTPPGHRRGLRPPKPQLPGVAGDNTPAPTHPIRVPGQDT